MTEEEWLASADPQMLLQAVQLAPTQVFLASPYSVRKLRLIAVACARCLLNCLPRDTPESLKINQIAEEWAESAVQPANVDHNWYVLHEDITDGLQGLFMHEDNQRFGADFAHIFRDITGNPFHPFCKRGRLLPLQPEQFDTNPLAAWRTSTVLSLAEAAYENREDNDTKTLDLACLAVLSDALEEAGCVGKKCLFCRGEGEAVELETPMLGKRRSGIPRPKAGSPKIACPLCQGGIIPHPVVKHLRSREPHYRGCCAVDLLVGKE